MPFIDQEDNGFILLDTFLKKVFEQKNVVGFDIMEYRPTDDPAPAMLLVRLIYKLIGYRFLRTFS